MRLSISSRVSIAYSAVLALSLLLLGVGLVVGNGVRSANLGVEMLSETLQRLGDQDRAQERLRLAIGESTRAAEARKVVPRLRWQSLSSQVQEFERMSAAVVAPPSAPPYLRAAIQRTKIAAMNFAPACRRLILVARTDPNTIKAAMPRFIDTLKQLERAHMEARDLVARQIGAAAKANAIESGRNINGVLVAGFAIVMIVFWMTTWLRTRLLSPISVIATRLREFNEDRPEGSIPGLARDDELGDLARGLAEYRAAVEERRVAEGRAAFLAHHDALTGLANRLLFENRLEHEIARARRTGDGVAVLAIDVDNFKAINDRHGHAGGDRALQRMAQLLSRCARKADLVARLGGDEFAIIQSGSAQPEAAEALVSRLFKASAATANEDIAIRMSVGVAVSAPEWASDDLYDLADLALYRAKSAGRNTARFFDAGLQEQERLRLRLARDLEQALTADQMHLVFQPIADAASLRIRGYEALLRWRHPALGDVPPERFIPIAESSGLIDTIGQWVIEKAMAAAATWAPELSLSLNLSPIQFRRPGLASQLVAIAGRHGVSVDRLEFEVTESATLLGYQREEVLSTLQALHAAGACVVMDDFGTGHSSLSNLKDFNFDKLKIDRSFVAAMNHHRPSASIVRATIGLGKSLGLTIVAEGVEDEGQLAQLRHWGCDQVQGYLIGRPTRQVAPSGVPSTVLGSAPS